MLHANKREGLVYTRWHVCDNLPGTDLIVRGHARSPRLGLATSHHSAVFLKLFFSEGIKGV